MYRNIYRKSYMRHIGRHIWPSGQEISVQSHYFPWISQNCPELCRILRSKRCIEMSLFRYGTSPEMRETEGKLCGKNLGMEMILFLHGNSAEMREILRGKTEAWKWVYFCMEFCGNEGNWGKIMYSIIFIDVSLIGNGTWKKSANKKFKQS